MSRAPVDLSFKGLNNLTEAMMAVPRPALLPLRTDSNNKYKSRSLRLSNNSITNLGDLELMLSYFVAQPLMLAWLDLSFNKLTNIDQVLCELKKLQILYLHGNNICDLKEVNKLAELNHLRTLTLHGNAIENTGGYRRHVVAVLPHLKRMDFSAVTNQERVLAKVWFKGHKKEENKREANNTDKSNTSRYD